MSLSYYMQEPVNGTFHEIDLTKFNFNLYLSSDITNYYLLLIKNDSDKYYSGGALTVSGHDTNALDALCAISTSSSFNINPSNYVASSSNTHIIAPGDILYGLIKVTKKIPTCDAYRSSLTIGFNPIEYFVDPDQLDIILTNKMLYCDSYYGPSTTSPTLYRSDYNYSILTGYHKIIEYSYIGTKFSRPFYSIGADIYICNQSTQSYKKLYHGHIGDSPTLTFGISPENKVYLSNGEKIYTFNYTLQVDNSYKIGVSFSGYSPDFTNPSLIVDNTIITDYEVIDQESQVITFDHDVHVGAIVVYRKTLTIPQLKRLLEAMV